MKDRSSNKYHWLVERSPARQAKKASGRTGRQWRKWYKALRHIAKYEQSSTPRAA